MPMRTIATGNGHIRKQDIMHESLDPLHVDQVQDVTTLLASPDAAIPFVVHFRTKTGVNTTPKFINRFKMSVIGVRYRLIAAGGASMTIKLQDGGGHDITEAVDVSVLANHAAGEPSLIDPTYSYVAALTGLKVATAGNAQADVWVTCVNSK